MQIGDSDVWVLSDTPASVRLRIPVPPSTNARQTVRYRRRRLAGGGVGIGPVIGSSDVAKGYRQNIYPLRIARANASFTPLENYTTVRFMFFLKNMRYDTHNGLKIACDVLEMAGFFVDDKYILPEVKAPVECKEEPRLIIEIPRMPDRI